MPQLILYIFPMGWSTALPLQFYLSLLLVVSALHNVIQEDVFPYTHFLGSLNRRAQGPLAPKPALEPPTGTCQTLSPSYLLWVPRSNHAWSSHERQQLPQGASRWGGISLLGTASSTEPCQADWSSNLHTDSSGAKLGMYPSKVPRDTHGMNIKQHML